MKKVFKQLLTKILHMTHTDEVVLETIMKLQAEIKTNHQLSSIGIQVPNINNTYLITLKEKNPFFLLFNSPQIQVLELEDITLDNKELYDLNNCPILIEPVLIEGLNIESRPNIVPIGRYKLNTHYQSKRSLYYTYLNDKHVILNYKQALEEYANDNFEVSIELLHDCLYFGPAKALFRKCIKRQMAKVINY